MSVKKIAVVAVFTIAATGIAGSLAHAEPTPANGASDTVSGSEHGVVFEVSKGADGKSLSASVIGGTFAITESALNVIDGGGNVIASSPLTVELEQGIIDLRPRIDGNGTRLAAEPIGVWRQSSPRERSLVTGAAIGGFIGAIIGMAIGVVGFVVLGLITMPVGFLIGAAIGAGIGAAIPNSDIPDRWDYYTPEPPSQPFGECSKPISPFNC